MNFFFFREQWRKNGNAYPFKSIQLHILQALLVTMIHIDLRDWYRKSWTKRNNPEREREREGTGILGMDKSLILLLFILSVGSTGLDTIKWDWKKLLSLYIPNVIGFCFVFCLFLLFFGLFWFAIPWWVSHSYQQNSNSDGKNYDTCLQRKSRGDIWEILVLQWIWALGEDTHWRG